jgi:hypothetical protein
MTDNASPIRALGTVLILALALGGGQAIRIRQLP